jgi:hypothetical protein
MTAWNKEHRHKMAQRRRNMELGKPGDHDEQYVYENPPDSQLDALLRKMKQVLDGVVGGKDDGDAD